ncbi:nucleoside-diphosphate-sugar epimerase [Friedmanniella endophytica]|uniref:Nucleoside-diphosphate-sugar epimerase n=1 Tax=Microlunatus kandeliicorticis TaxID=1759536 RepID=A0A7W3P4I3_9ACTN|nr:NAD-dependent epimerase/dehydratase family protein [Microlunatus kandeliicorticis]MBA8792867.1 nucleoside-diphosphate-sugar epimerase [Microlunatus kandeliicorticis]
MRLLVLGGTGFIGRAVVEAALSAGHEVTTFNRGVSDTDVMGVQVIRGDRGDAESIAALVRSGPWSVVIDCSGYVPRNVLAVTRALEPVAGHLVFMSSVSAYAGWPVAPLDEASPLLEAPADAGPDFGTDTEDGPTRYGYQKAGCEAAVHEVFGPSRSTVLRPGVVLGPREYVGRLVWWLNRVATGKRVIAPAPAERHIQPIDVRDLADFTLRCSELHLSRAFTIAGPVRQTTFKDLIDACRSVTGSSAEVSWVPPDILTRLGVRQWSELPLWRTADGVWKLDSTRAFDAGLSSRPIAGTAAATWSWMQLGGLVDGRERASEIGLSPAHEQALLAVI